jgi:hypothetical protein
VTETATKTATGTDETTNASDGLPRVSRRSVLACLNSARYWDAVLPAYANQMQRLADRWAILSGALAAVGGLGVWATISKDARTWAQFVVSAVAFAAAIAALVPRVKSYGEMAGQARQLLPNYGRVEGLLGDVLDNFDTTDDARVRKIVVDFNTVKALKDTTLRHLPRKPVQPRGLKTDENDIQTWPPDVYQQAKAQMHPVRTAVARRITGVFR